MPLNNIEDVRPGQKSYSATLTNGDATLTNGDGIQDNNENKSKMDPTVRDPGDEEDEFAINLPKGSPPQL